MSLYFQIIDFIKILTISVKSFIMYVIKNKRRKI